MTFSALAPDTESVEELERRIQATEMILPTRQLFRDLVRGGYVDGATYRNLADDDSPVGARIRKLDYEAAVKGIVSKQINSSLKNLFYDIAHYVFSEGNRTSGSQSEIIQPLLNALG
jgi:hypothetical protein